VANQYFADQPLLSAEVPYFDLPPDDWELLLVRMRQLGASTIVACVPWSWHEAQPGVFDMEGRSHSQRDLVGFVRLCGRLGLRALLKPGPLLGGALPGGGIPPWLLRAHPEIHALRPDGRPWLHAGSATPRACALHPAYLAAARRWTAAFSAAMLPLQAPNGPIVALVAGDALLEGGPGLALDYNAYVVGELWPKWLRESVARGPWSRVSDSEAAADGELRATGYRLRTIPRTLEPPVGLEDLKRYAGLAAFADWLYAEAKATVVGWLREDGWAAPICHSPPGPARAARQPGYHTDAGDAYAARDGETPAS
jgi:beta-galactosidase